MTRVKAVELSPEDNVRHFGHPVDFGYVGRRRRFLKVVFDTGRWLIVRSPNMRVEVVPERPHVAL